MSNQSLPNFDYEKSMQGLTSGVDEAGRGPLAGPVIACACVIMDENISLLKLINDSKKLHHKKREEIMRYLPDFVNDGKIAYATCTASVFQIEELNILQATMLAMKGAISKLQARLITKNLELKNALIDGNKIPQGLYHLNLKAITGGDSKSLSIALASIIAKEKRDALMERLHLEHPEYNFAKHKGYGTEEHKKAILKHGASPHHRKLFLRKILT